MSFKMRFEGKEVPEKRFSGTIVGVGDSASSRWIDFEWRSLRLLAIDLFVDNEKFIIATSDSVLFHTLWKVPALHIVRILGDTFHFKGPLDDERLQVRIKKEQQACLA